MITAFDPQMDPIYFIGEFTKVEVIDAAPPIIVGNPNLDPSKPYWIEVEWTLKGFFVPPWLSALDNPSGSKRWVVEAYATPMGPGQEKKIAEINIPVGPPYNQPKTYSATLTVLAGELQEHTPGGPSGIYKLTISAFLDTPLGLPGYAISGYATGTVIRAENPV